MEEVDGEPLPPCFALLLVPASLSPPPPLVAPITLPRASAAYQTDLRPRPRSSSFSSGLPVEVEVDAEEEADRWSLLLFVPATFIASSSFLPSLARTREALERAALGALVRPRALLLLLRREGSKERFISLRNRFQFQRTKKEVERRSQSIVVD